MITKELVKPLFALALLILFVIVGIERNAIAATAVARNLPSFLGGGNTTPSLEKAFAGFSDEQQAELNRLREEKADELAKLEDDLSGFGVAYLRFVDVILLFTLALMTLGIAIPKYIHGKIQGCLTVLFCLLLIIVSIVAIFIALGKLLFMVALFLSFPFGTIAYLIIFGSFPREAGLAVLHLLLILKLLFLGVLLFSHQKFVENLGLMLFTIASLVVTVVVGILYTIVPGILVSITDALAAVIVGIVAVILAIILGLTALISIIFALKPL